VAIKNRGGLPLQAGPGAPAGNTNAQRHGLYSQNPDLRVTVSADTGLDVLEDYVGLVAGSALWVAQALTEVDEPLVDGYALESLSMLYAAVAGEAYDMRAGLQGRTGLRASPLGRLTERQYDELLRGSAASLELLLSQVASAKTRLEVNGLLVASRKIDGERELNPTLGYLAGGFRKVLRQLWRHAEYVHWAARDDDEATLDPAAVLASRLADERMGEDGED